MTSSAWTRNRLWFLPLLTVACTVDEDESGSSPPRVAISSQSAALTAQENAEAALRGVLNAGGFIAESQGIADGLSSLSGSSQSCETVSFECASDATDCLPSTTTECTTVEDEVSTDDLLEARQDLHDGLDVLIERRRQPHAGVAFITRRRQRSDPSATRTRSAHRRW